MAKFHISEDGNPRNCNAQPGNCRFGGSIEHFDTVDAARKHYEEMNGTGITTQKRTTQATRIAKLPEIKGIIYEADPYGEDKNDLGVAYSTADTYRIGRNGQRSRIASITIYDDNTVILWSRIGANQADINAQKKIAAAVQAKEATGELAVSNFSSNEFKNFTKVKHKDTVRDVETDEFGLPENWTKQVDHVSTMFGPEMSHTQMQIYSLSTIAHNFSPAIGRVRSAAASENKEEIAKAKELVTTYSETAIKGLLSKLNQNPDIDPADSEKFVKDSIAKNLTPVFEQYSQDPYKIINIDNVFKRIATDIANYSKNK